MMRNFLYFLLGFVLVFTAGISFAFSPGDIVISTDESGTFERTGLNGKPNIKPVGFDVTSSPNYTHKINGLESASQSGTTDWYIPGFIAYMCTKRIDTGAYQWEQMGFSGFYAWPSFLGPYGQATKIPIGQTPASSGLVCEVAPPDCDPPNALNPSGECVNCPSGVFLVTGYCVPECDYSHPYIPGELYNPPEGTGTCVMPDCGAGQKKDAEGRCVPDCPEGQKIETTTGTCVSDCPYGTHEVEGECINDCLPGFYKDAETGSCVEERGCLPGEEFIQGLCVNKCLPGETRNADGGCDPAPVNCPFGQHEENGVCVASLVNCPPGMSFSTISNTCTPDPVEVSEERSVVDNQDGTFTETRTTTIITSDGTGSSSSGTSGGTISGTVTTTTTGNIPAAGTGSSNSFTPGASETATTITPPSVDKYQSPEHSLNWQGWNSQKRRFAEEGPLKILKKLQDLFNSFDVEPETPSFDFIVGGHTFNVNLHAFDEIASGCRFLMGCFMTIGAVSFGYKIYGLV